MASLSWSRQSRTSKRKLGCAPTPRQRGESSASLSRWPANSLDSVFEFKRSFRPCSPRQWEQTSVIQSSTYVLLSSLVSLSDADARISIGFPHRRDAIPSTIRTTGRVRSHGHLHYREFDDERRCYETRWWISSAEDVMYLPGRIWVGIG